MFSTSLHMKPQFDMWRARSFWIRTCPCTRLRCAGLVLSKEQSSLFKFLPFVPHHLHRLCEVGPKDVWTPEQPFANLENLLSSSASQVVMSVEFGWAGKYDLVSKNFCTRAELLNLFKTNASHGMHKRKGFDRVPGLELQWGNNLWIDAIFWFGPISFFFQLYSQWEIEVPAATLAEVPGHGSQQEVVRFVSQCWQTQADRSPAFCFALLDNIFPAVVSCLVGHGKS